MSEDRQRRILLVEDDAAIPDMVMLALRDEGYDVVVAPDGATALHLLTEQAADVILLDMRMPGTGGWSFAAQYAQQACEIGAAGYLAKPFDLDTLLDVVAAHTH
jgi:DNA-binding response OmpR family regulator